MLSDRKKPNNADLNVNELLADREVLLLLTNTSLRTCSKGFSPAKFVAPHDLLQKVQLNVPSGMMMVEGTN